MKIKWIFLSIALILASGQLKAQVIPPPNPDLAINIVSGYNITFNFDELNDYYNGIIGEGHNTYIRVGSIYDWKLDFKADQIMFYGTGDPSNTMELNNVGVVVISTGTNQDDGSNLINYAQNLPLALESNDITLLSKGTLTNKGYGIRNSFTLEWEMGTQRGNMNNISMFEQFLGADTYTIQIILTLSVY